MKPIKYARFADVQIRAWFTFKSVLYCKINNTEAMDGHGNVVQLKPDDMVVSYDW